MAPGICTHDAAFRVVLSYSIEGFCTAVSSETQSCRFAWEIEPWVTGVMCLSRAVHGLDATAAQTFGTLFNMLEGLGVELVITHMENPEMEKLLRAHGVIGPNCCMCVPWPVPELHPDPSEGCRAHVVSLCQLLQVHARPRRRCWEPWCCVAPL